MAVGINMPGYAPQKEKKVDPLDRIMQGLNIASTVYGIKNNIDQSKLAKLKEEREAKAFAEQIKQGDFDRQTKIAEMQLKGSDPVVTSDAGPVRPGEGGFTMSEWARLQKDAELKKTLAEAKKAEAGPARDPLTQLLAEERLHKMQADRERTNFEKSPTGRLEKLGAEAKTKVGTYASMLETLTEYENAFRGGGRKSRIDSKTPLIGTFVSDTPIDTFTRKLTDDIGRLRSGGAINMDEEKRFLEMLPRPGDRDEMQAEKLLQVRNEVGTKLQAFGLNPDELAQSGFDGNKLGVVGEFAKVEGRGLSPLTTEKDIAASLVPPGYRGGKQAANAGPALKLPGSNKDEKIIRQRNCSDVCEFSKCWFWKLYTTNI